MTTAISEPSKEDCLQCDTGELNVSKAVFQGASEDGSRVFFLTTQPLLDGDEDETMDLYEYDFDGPVGERITQVSKGGVGDITPGRGAQVEGVARVSEDGSHVYFVAEGVLTGTPNSVGDIAQLGADNFYVYDTETKQTAFIGVLGEGDTQNWQPQDLRPVDATRDGRFVVFTSTKDLTKEDTGSGAQVFEYDAETKTLVRVSVGEGGFNNDGRDGDAASIAHPSYTESFDPAPQLGSVSEDGSYVVFQSANALTSHAAAGCNNVYEYHSGQVSLISDGQDCTSAFRGRPSTALDGIDSSGADIFFETADPLLPQDGDTQVDIYDARIGGGFPGAVPSPECEGDGCQGALAPAPTLPTVDSVNQPAGEQVVESSAPSIVKVKVHARSKKAKAKSKKVKAKSRRLKSKKVRAVRRGKKRSKGARNTTPQRTKSVLRRSGSR